MVKISNISIKSTISTYKLFITTTAQMTCQVMFTQLDIAILRAKTVWEISYCMSLLTIHLIMQSVSAEQPELYSTFLEETLWTLQNYGWGNDSNAWHQLGDRDLEVSNCQLGISFNLHFTIVQVQYEHILLMCSSNAAHFQHQAYIFLTMLNWK